MHRCQQGSTDVEFFECWVFDLIEKITARAYDCYYAEADGKKEFWLWICREDDPEYLEKQALSASYNLNESNANYTLKDKLVIKLRSEWDRVSSAAKIIKDVADYLHGEYY